MIGDGKIFGLPIQGCYTNPKPCSPEVIGADRGHGMVARFEIACPLCLRRLRRQPRMSVKNRRIDLRKVLLGLLALSFFSLTTVISGQGIVIGASGELSRGLVSEAGVVTLRDVINNALTNNPRIRIAGKEVETEIYNIRAAKAERMPKVDFTSGVAHYRYPTPLTPVVIESLSPGGIDIPRFERTIYDGGATLRLPLYRGGRLQRSVAIAELRKEVAEDNLRFGKEDLIYNVTSVYHKVLQLQRREATNRAMVTQLEAHRRDVEALYRVGSAPYLDLVKTDVELAHAIQNRLQAENDLDGAYELLRILVGEENIHWRPVLDIPSSDKPVCSAITECRKAAQKGRADLAALRKRLQIGEQRVKMAQGRHYPDVSLSGGYFDRSGTDLEYRENWDIGVRLVVPVFDGGLIQAEVARERNELAKLKDEKRGLELTIEKEVKDAFLAVENGRAKIAVAETAIVSARENLRVEDLKYRVGASTNTDVIDAQTAMHRAETDLWQARFDCDTAIAALRRAVGGTLQWEE